MLLTVIVMMIVMVLVTVVFSQGMQSQPLARQGQNYQAALQAAESGVQDYIDRLDNNTTYYLLNNTDATNPAMQNGATWTSPSTATSWAAVAGPVVNEWFRYLVNSSTTAQTGIVTLTVTGAAGQNPWTAGNAYSVRTIKEQIHLSGFTSFLYFTNYEILAPSITGVDSNPYLANGTTPNPNYCIFHAQDANNAGTFGPPSSCSGELIDFVGNANEHDILNGPIFSNDEFRICGNPAFPFGATSAYDQGASLSNASFSYGALGSYANPSGCADTPTFGGPACTVLHPVCEPAALPTAPFPTTNTLLINDLPAVNQGGGCLYTGPLTVLFGQSGGVGNMTVTLATRTDTGAKTTTGSNVVKDTKITAADAGTSVSGSGIPGGTFVGTVNTGVSFTMVTASGGSTAVNATATSNNVSITIGSTATAPTGTAFSCSGASAIPLPPNGLLYDQTAPGCTTASCHANASVSGVVEGQVTVGSDTNITVTNNVTDFNSNGSDIIGLSAADSIVLNQPGCGSDPDCGVPNLTIQAAMVALNDSIYLADWGGQNTLGTLTVLGSMAQDYRGPVGTHNGNGTIASGYSKNYNYDSRLHYIQPPYFTSPTLPNWIKTGFAECNSTITPSLATC